MPEEKRPVKHLLDTWIVGLPIAAVREKEVKRNEN
jgi:hypothetical protein